MRGENFNKIIHKNIKKCMSEKSINLKKISENLGETSPNVCKKMKQLELGNSITTLTLCEIAQALEVEPWELLK